MKIEESVEYMSKMYLERVIKSFTQDYPSNKEGEEYREILKKNAETLSEYSKIRKRLDQYISDNHKDPYANKLLFNFILRSILAKPNFSSTEEEIIKTVISKEQEIVKLSDSSESFRHIQNKSLEIFSAVLETALEDEVISNDELSLLVRLRKKLSISEKDQYLIQAKLGLFPSPKNKVHTSPQIIKGINDLQKCGIIFYCNIYEDNSEKIFVIPDEIVAGVKSVLGIELIEDKYSLLLEKLRNKQLRSILDSRNLYKSGTKDDLVERIMHSGIKPSEALNYLSSDDLYGVCSNIPSLTVSGTKNERIDRLINYFSKLVIKDFVEEDTGQKFYEYLEQLAERDIDNLLGNNIVKDHDYIDKAFEEGTKYLFQEILNIPLLEFSGNEHADGAVKFGNESILLWDNKSRKNGEPYTFPDVHLKQFKRYIRNEREGNRRVSCFLIVTANIDPAANRNAVKLKAHSGVDTDVAIITAENLKLVAQKWRKYSKGDQFNLHIFNTTGILDWETLRDRMDLFD